MILSGLKIPRECKYEEAPGSRFPIVGMPKKFFTKKFRLPKKCLEHHKNDIEFVDLRSSFQ